MEIPVADNRGAGRTQADRLPVHRKRNGERMLPGFDVTTYAVIVVTSFAMLMSATELATRWPMRKRS